MPLFDRSGYERPVPECRKGIINQVKTRSPKAFASPITEAGRPSHPQDTLDGGQVRAKVPDGQPQTGLAGEEDPQAGHHSQAGHDDISDRRAADTQPGKIPTIPGPERGKGAALTHRIKMATFME